MRDNDKFNSNFVYEIFTKLMRVVQEEYIRQMKKCIVLKEMEDPRNFNKFQKMKIPVRLQKKTTPYFGVIQCPKYKLDEWRAKIKKEWWGCNEDMANIIKWFSKKCIDF